LHLRDENEAEVQSKASVRCDGHLATLLNYRNRKVTIREPKATDNLWATPLKFMGRGVDTTGRHTLAEVLDASTDLHLTTSSTEAIRVVAGYCEVNGHAWQVEVALDSNRAFMPTRITIYDGLLLWPVEQLNVTESVVKDGIWIPTAGTDAVW